LANTAAATSREQIFAVAKLRFLPDADDVATVHTPGKTPYKQSTNGPASIAPWLGYN